MEILYIINGYLDCKYSRCSDETGMLCSAEAESQQIELLTRSVLQEPQSQ